MALFRTMRAKILGIVLGVGLLFTATAATGIWQLNLALNQYQSLIDHEGHAVSSVQQIEIEFKNQVMEWKHVLLRGQETTALDQYWQAFETSEAKVKALAAELEGATTDPEVKAAAQAFIAKHEELGREYRTGLLSFKASGFDPRNGDILTRGKDTSANDDLEALASNIVAQQAARATLVRAQATRTILLSGGALGLALLAAVVLLLVLVNRIITRRVALLVRQVQVVSGGDFRDSAVASLAMDAAKDEIGELTRAFVGMHGTVRGLLSEMARTSLTLSEHAGQMHSVANESAQAANQVAEAMGAVAAGASSQASSSGDAAQTVADLRRAVAEIATGSQEQALAVEQTSGTLEQMLWAIDAVAANSAGVAESSVQAGETAAAGATVVERTIRSMAQIEKTVQSSAAKLGELGRSSAQIGEITNVITEIAEQTNLLALNAAIEAARAGEHGRGFAVVADEVRKLAERAAKSAGEITGLVQTIQSATRAAIAAMQQGTTEVQEGAKMASEAGTALAQILTAAEGTTRAVQEISAAAQQLTASSREVAGAFERVSAVSERSAAATEEMAAGADLVTQTITAVAEISQENAASAEEVSASVEEITASTEEVASAAQQLQAVAAELKAQVQRFRL